jgi:glycerate dehydrogenase
MGERKPRIVVLDGEKLNPGDNPWTEVEAYGDLTVYDWTPAEEVVSRAKDAEIVLTNKTPIPRDTLDQLSNLQFIGVLATGFNVVDVAHARSRGIPVSNVPVYGTNSVAQYVFALALELCHHVGLHSDAVHNGEWSGDGNWSFWRTPLVELYGKTMAIVGFGRIGRRVGELANAFGMEVLAVDVYQGNPPSYRPFAFVSAEEAFRRADVVSLNAALTPENEGMVNAALLKSMKPSAFLVNASRGQLVNEADLAAALNEGTIAGAALDVVSSEPIKPDNPLLSAKNCVITPHMAWAALEARQRLMQTTAENIRAFLNGEPQNLVN